MKSTINKLIQMRALKLFLCFVSLFSAVYPMVSSTVNAASLYSTPFTDFPKHRDGYDGLGVCREDRLAKGATEGHLRWSAEEPNILAHLPILATLGGTSVFMGSNQGYKHHSLVFQSQVRDIEAPFMEIVQPYDLGVDADAANIVGDIIDPRTNKPLSLPVIPIIAGGQREIEKQRNEKVQLATKLQLYMNGAPGEINYPGLGDGPVPSPRAQTAIVGPRGCNIGGWYEMMLYQARCIRWFKLNCICDYGKTFRKGSAEAYVLLRGGRAFNTVSPYLSEDGKSWSTRNGYKSMPLAWRGTASPYYAPNATVGSHLWDKNGDNIQDDDYKGLSEARPGDFMIYDENLLTESVDGAGTDIMVNARYRRHIAYVESVYRKGAGNNGPVRWINIKEWNYGKNQDSCGNTDRWRTKTNRRIAMSAYDIPSTQPCDNPDWTECYEKNWSRIKLYRPSLDIASPARPICNIDDMPNRITHKRLDDMGIASLDDAKLMSAVQLLNTDAWKRFRINAFDAQEVSVFIMNTRGLCDPPLPRGNVPDPGQVQLAIKASAASLAPANNDLKPGDVPKDLPTSEDTPYWASSGVGGVSAPSTSHEGFNFTDLCGLVGGNAANVCDIVMGCITTEECAINDCADDFSTTGCSTLCALDPDNKLCAAIACKTTPGRACCALFDIPECCALFELKDEIFRCLDNPDAGCCSVLDTTLVEGGDVLADKCADLAACAGSPGIACCELFPESAATCRAILGCTGTISAGSIDGCCTLYPEINICEVRDCLLDPTVECCNLVPSAAECTAMVTCATNPSVACCKDYPDNDLCKFYSCSQSPTSECCAQSVNVLSTECLALAKCAILPDAGCCATFSSESLLSCSVLGCASSPGEACCALVPQIPECKALVSCVLNPSSACCTLLPGEPACTDFLACLSSPDAACCTRFTGAGSVCDKFINCFVQPNVACCAVLGATGGAICSKILACNSGNILSVECCTLFPDSHSDCADLLNCEVNPTSVCCAAFPATPSCKLLADCAGNPSFACCAMTSDSITSCSAILACLANPTAACCTTFGGNALVCDLLNNCVLNPDVTCCSKLFPDHPVCKLFNRSRIRKPGSSVCK